MLRNHPRRLAVIFVALTIGAGLACGSSDDAEEPTAEAETDTSFPRNTPPPLLIDPSKSYTATIQMAKGGSIVIELAAADAPVTVNNFVFLARAGFYDSVTFHRVIPGFMAQTGDPTGTGSGGPGYRFRDEFSPRLRHDGSGVLSMANAGPNTNGSQFFITYDATSHLDNVHSVFGKVVSGMDLLVGLSPRNPSEARTPGDVITTIEIEESG